MSKSDGAVDCPALLTKDHPLSELTSTYALRLASQAPLMNRCWGLADLSPVVGVGVDALEVDAVELCVGFVEERAIVEEVVDI